MSSYGYAIPLGLPPQVSSAAGEVVTEASDPSLSSASKSRLDVWLGWLVRPLHLNAPATHGRWVAKYVERIGELEYLEADWDSFGGLPLHASAVSAMTNVLIQLDTEIQSEPLVTLNPEGGLNCEWTSGNYTLELSSYPDQRVDVYFTDALHEQHELNVEEARDLRKWAWQASTPAA